VHDEPRDDVWAQPIGWFAGKVQVLMLGGSVTTSGLDDPGAGFQPSEEWIDEFNGQFSHKLRHDLLAYARGRARVVQRAGGRVSNAYPEDLVADVIADTLAGVVEWVPGAKSLHVHLKDTIAYRARDERLRAQRYVHASIETGSAPEEALLEASLAHDRRGESAPETIFAGEVIARLRGFAVDDADALSVFDAILVEGAQTRAEICEVTGMSAKRFRNTRERIHRLAERIDQQTVAAGLRGARA
jgi:hypothetical protein